MEGEEGEAEIVGGYGVGMVVRARGARESGDRGLRIHGLRDCMERRRWKDGVVR